MREATSAPPMKVPIAMPAMAPPARLLWRAGWAVAEAACTDVGEALLATVLAGLNVGAFVCGIKLVDCVGSANVFPWDGFAFPIFGVSCVGWGLLPRQSQHTARAISGSGKK